MECIDNLFYFGYLLAILLRWTVSQFPYSGFSKPPMFGDYEAQRHWMEITVNVEVDQWYSNSSHNDLLYWGLDYPPLTAYHSYINGKIAQYINPSWVELFESRGYEGYYHKIFMRSTVLVIDLLIYFSAITYYWSISSLSVKPRDIAIVCVLTLINPPMILIDYGHFQYNCVSLGLFIWSIAFLTKEYHILGSIAFALALNYKQMSLYFAFPIFWYLLSRCAYLLNQSKRSALIKLVTIALSVVITFIICWLPYITNYDSTLQVVKRLFPLSRGIYEDKVANFWCSISVLFKLKNYFSDSTLALISAIITFMALIPSNFDLFRRPSLKLLKYSLINSSLVFFLFSFQVHEKSILLPTIAMILIFDRHPLTVLWFIIISTFSLQPLLIKDKLMIPFYSLLIIFLCAFFNAYKDLIIINPNSRKEKLISLSFFSSLMGCLILSIASLTIAAPKSLPDIHAVLNSLFSCFHFILFVIYFHKLQFDIYVPPFGSLNLSQFSFTKLKKKLN